MQKRNFILLIASLVMIVFVTFMVFLYTSPKTNTNKGDNEGSPITNFFANFLPFGDNKNSSNTEEGVVDISNDNNDIQVSQGSLNKISSMPVAGYGIFMKERFKEVPVVIPQPTIPTETTTTTEQIKTDNTKKTTKVEKPTPPPTEFVSAVRYVEKANGNIYQTFADKIDERKFTNTVIPRVHEAFFGKDGESVIMRYLKEDVNVIQTYLGALPKEILGADTMESNELVGRFLPENITDLSIAKDGTKLFYLFNYKNSSVGITALTNGEKRVQIFNSPFTEWLSFWPKENIITVTTKPSADVPGYMYSIDPLKKTYNKILGDINGLTTLTAPDGNLVLYSGKDMILRLYHTDQHTSENLGVKTLPEKCTWNKNSTYVYCAVPKEIYGNNYPDSWYQGETSFSDEIWRIDVLNSNASIVVNLSNMDGGEEIDGIRLTVDDNEDYLFFMNKKDSYLWELKLQ